MTVGQIWLGGAPGAGKTTIARRISRELDLPLHTIDLWTYVHADRLPPTDLAAELAAGPAAAADAFDEHARRRWPLIAADLADRDLGGVPAIVEGPQLLAELAAGAEVTGEVLGAVWLVPTPERIRRARRGRDVTRAEARRLEALVARDTELAERRRWEAEAVGWPVVAIGDDPDWAAAHERVCGLLESALSAAPRLAAGEELSRQRGLENEAAALQGERWRRAAELVEEPTYDYACECGRSGCHDTVTLSPSEYTDRRRRGFVLA